MNSDNQTILSNTLSEVPLIGSLQKTKKKLAYEAKLLKKQNNQRTMEERQLEVDKVFIKLQELGITREMVEEFDKISQNFIEFGYGASGAIKMPELHRKLVYLLTNDKKHQISTMLQAI
jgi:hypothetical protein